MFFKSARRTSTNEETSRSHPKVPQKKGLTNVQTQACAPWQHAARLITLAVVNAGLLGSWKNFTIKTSLAYELPQMKNAILPWRAFMATQERCLFWECGDRLQHCLIVCKEVAADWLTSIQWRKGCCEDSAMIVIL